MRGLRPTVRRVVTFVVLVAVWCGLWKEVSIANLLGGSAIAITIIASGIGTPGQGGVRLGPLLRLSWLVLVDLVTSTSQVAYEILTPTDRTSEAIVAVNMPPHTKEHQLLLTIAITLTPGTAVVDADPDTGTLYLHLLYHHREAETVAHVKELARLACEALPTGAAR